MLVDFNSYKNKKTNNLTEEDILNLILVFKHEEYDFININKIMKSLGRNSKLEKFKTLFKNINTITDEDNYPIMDLKQAYQKMLKDGLIIETLENEFIILLDNDKINDLKERYSKNILELFNDLMFYVNNDLKYGLENWELVFEDEILKYPRYPSIVTGEFIDKDKNEDTMEDIRKKSINRLRNFYNK